MKGRRKKRQKSKAKDRAARLLPIDEQVYAADPPPEAAEGQTKEGVLRVTTGSLKLPEEFVPDPSSESARAANRVVVVIVALSLAFIAWITWLIATGE